MPVKNTAKRAYKVTNGFNIADGENERRFDIGEAVFEGELTAAQEAELFELGCLELIPEAE